ncbi:MAG: Type 1 glutamine amidotransferase-like domain-containing protein [Halobacteriovoraceae bacterium]|nr:Type 1 glutamine amidotransferase-like domain-containing protein [Halobacteriovoraceae bacterium]
MKLVFYSGEDENNFELHSYLVGMTNSTSPLITFIPSCSHDCYEDYHDFVNSFLGFNLNRFLYFPIDNPIDPVLEHEVFNSNIIHLSGGNTFYFLYYLRKNGLLKKLKEFVNNGGILTGLSAGAILMTQSIGTAGFPDFDRDENEMNIRNLKALGFVDFDFFPHYKNSKRYDLALREYSRTSKRPLFACPDGNGIIVDDLRTIFLGQSVCFFDGKKLKVGGS